MNGPFASHPSGEVFGVVQYGGATSRWVRRVTGGAHVVSFCEDMVYMSYQEYIERPVIMYGDEVTCSNVPLDCGAPAEHTRSQ